MSLFADPTDETQSGAAPWYVTALRMSVALFMFSIMAVMFVDVIGRYFFSASIQGGFEIIAFLLGLLIFSGFPLVTYSQDHITVGLLDVLFHGRVQWFRDLFIRIVSAAAVGFIAHRMWDQAELLRAEGQVGQMFDIEIAPFVYVFSLLALASLALQLRAIWEFIRAGTADGAAQ